MMTFLTNETKQVTVKIWEGLDFINPVEKKIHYQIEIYSQNNVNLTIVTELSTESHRCL